MREDYVEKIRNLMSRLQKINETPEYSDEDLPLGPVGIIHSDDILDFYQLFDVIGNEVFIYRDKKGSFVAGAYFQDSKDLIEVVSVNLDKNIQPVIPTQLKDESYQVYWVRVAEDFAKNGLSSLVYQSIVAEIDLVSDRIHFRGGKRLWQSLAQNSNIPIYIFDGHKNDYMRDEAGTIITYNGKNITEESIWGGEDKQKVLLVASTAPKK